MAVHNHWNVIFNGQRPEYGTALYVSLYSLFSMLVVGVANAQIEYLEASLLLSLVFWYVGIVPQAYI